MEQSTVVGQAWASLSPRASVTAAYVINNQEIAFDMADSFAAFQDVLPPGVEPSIIVLAPIPLGVISCS